MKVSLFFLVVCLLQASRIVYVAEAQNLTCPDGSPLGQKCYLECPDPSQVCLPMGSDIGFGSGTGNCFAVTAGIVYLNQIVFALFGIRRRRYFWKQLDFFTLEQTPS